MTSRIINSFQQRRQLAQALDALADTAHEEQLLQAVRAIARDYPTDLIATAIIKRLDTDSSQLRGGLGHLSALLPTEKITPTLRGIVGNRQLPAQNRVTAALLLERFLGESVPQALLADLNQTNEIAYQSLREAVDEGHHNRHVLLEYVTQMRQAGQEIAFMVMQLLERLPIADQVELLRLIAYDERLSVAQEAVRQLEALVGGTDAEGALRSLYTLQFALQPELSKQIERTLRKLQFSGRRYEATAATAWRALLSPADPFGNQTLWFINTPDANSATGRIFGVIVNDFYGILNSFGSDALTSENMPTLSAIGDMVIVTADGGETGVLLEAPFSFCLWRLKQSLQAHWQAPQTRPLPGEFTLYNDWVLQATPPAPEPELIALIAGDEESDPPAEPSLPELEETAIQLLAHPAMEGWTGPHRNLVQALRPVLATLTEVPPDRLTVAVLEELNKRPEQKHLLAVIASGLRSQAAWLHIAGNPNTAQLASKLAQATNQLPPRQNPLLARMISATLRHSTTDNP